MISFLTLGFVIGLQHALEADHLAAVSALVSRKRGFSTMARHGALWGVGHTAALFLITAPLLLLEGQVPHRFEDSLELVVGLMLIGLGLHVLYRLSAQRVHVHLHEHEDGTRHLHAHSHAQDAHHRHDHPAALATRDGTNNGRWRTVLVGLTHGAAGSAALLVWVAASLESTLYGLLYVLVFGLGSILGMAGLTSVLAVPLGLAQRRASILYKTLQIAVSVFAMGVGIRLAVASAGSLLQ